MNDVVIQVDGVSKKFSHTVKHTMRYGIQDLSRNMFGLQSHSKNLRKGEFWAVNDISFKVRRGETLGLIGANGSGKSTILKMLNGTFMPDQGKIQVRGRVGALIELGAGFHPLLTGRENIYIVGTIIGMSKEEIDRKFETIVDFSGLGEFIESPVKYYSSGMNVRLGFSIAVHSDPDIFLIDEVLSVGDFKFKQKCSERLNEIRKKATIVFVSHSMRDVMMLCTQALVMSKGKALMISPPEEAIDHYLRELDASTDEIKQEKKNYEGQFGEIFRNKKKIESVECQWVNGEGCEAVRINHGEKLTLQFSFKLLEPILNELIIGVPIWNKNGNLITSMTTDFSQLTMQVPRDGWFKGKLTLDPLVLNPGEYVAALCIRDGPEFLHRDLISGFRVNELKSYFGFVTVPHHWEF